MYAAAVNCSPMVYTAMMHNSMEDFATPDCQTHMLSHAQCSSMLACAVLEECLHAQIAARAQRASVEPSEIQRYEDYDARHGARYVDPSVGNSLGEDDW